MKHFRITTVLAGLAALLATTSLFAADAVVDDNEDGTDQNEFDQYWYYYDDNSGVKPDDRPQADSTSQPSVIDVPYTLRPRMAFNNPEDTWPVKEYTFLIREEGANKVASMPFIFGETWKASYGTATPYVGMGTMLAAEGKSISLEGALSISFKIRCRVNSELTVVFKVETQDISEDSSFAYYSKSFVVGTDWSSETIELSSLLQPGWTPPASERNFAIDKVTKIAWEVPGNLNDITGDTLEVDDVVISPYVFVSPTVWPNAPCEVPLPDNVFSTFEGTYKDQTPLNTYWFAYNDAEIGGTSVISRGAGTDPATNHLALAFEEGSGSDGVGHAPFIDFTLGKKITKPNAADTSRKDNVQGFAGIGFNVYDSGSSTFFDAATGKYGTAGLDGGVDGIYFEYLADGDFKYMTLEISDIHDVGDASTQTAPYSRGSGIVWYRNFQKTGLETWRSARLRFSDLIVNNTWFGYNDIPLDITRLAKVQFKIQGAEGDGGHLAIDNVYFTPAVGVRRSITRQGAADALRAGYRNGIVTVDWKNNRRIHGRITLLDTKGTVVTSVPMTESATCSSGISAARLSSGLYFIRVTGIDAGGNTVTRQTSVSIVR